MRIITSIAVVAAVVVSCHLFPCSFACVSSRIGSAATRRDAEKVVMSVVFVVAGVVVCR